MKFSIRSLNGCALFAALQLSGFTFLLGSGQIAESNELHQVSGGGARHGSLSAHVAMDPFELRIENGHQLVISKRLKELEQAVDVLPHPKIAWSPDGLFLALDFDVDEDTHVTEVFETRNLRLTWSGSSSSSQWLEKGHVLLVVPNADVEGQQSKAGVQLIEDGSRVRVVGGKCKFVSVVGIKGSVVTLILLRDSSKVDSRIKLDVSSSDNRGACD